MYNSCITLHNRKSIGQMCTSAYKFTTPALNRPISYLHTYMTLLLLSQPVLLNLIYAIYIRVRLITHLCYYGYFCRMRVTGSNVIPAFYSSTSFLIYVYVLAFRYKKLKEIYLKASFVKFKWNKKQAQTKQA